MTAHGLTHEDADVVVEAAGGWYFERLLDGRVRISKYRISNPNAGEVPGAQITLAAQEWNDVIAAIGLGESTVVGKISPSQPDTTVEPPPAGETVVPTGQPTVVESNR